MRIFILLLFTASIFASESFKPKVTLGYGYNIHNASFKELPNVPNCCDQFDNGSGFGLGIGLGFDYVFDDKLLGIADYYSFGLMYRDFSGLLEKEVISGNLIREFGFEPAYSKISIDAGLSYLFTSHYLNFKISEKYKLDAFANFDIGFAMMGSYEQKEEALSPSDYAFENGDRVRDQSSGDLPDQNSLFIAFGAGLKYNSVPIGNLELIPELSYRYSVLPVVNSLDWNVSSIELGISLSGFNFSKEKDPEIPPVPKPLPPAEPKPKEIVKVIQLESEMIIDSPNGVEDGVITYNVDEQTYKEIYSLPPVIYYKDNEVRPSRFEGLNKSKVLNIYGNQEDLIKTIADKIKKSEAIKLIITTTFSNEIGEERKSNLFEELEKDGLTTNDLAMINIEIRRQDKDKFKYEELASEYEKAEFIFKNDKLIPYQFREYKKVNIQDEIEIDYRIKSNLDNAVPRSNISFLSTSKNLNDKDKITLNTSDLMDFYNSGRSKVIFSSKVTAGVQNNELQRELDIKANVKKSEFVNYNSEDNSSQLILGFFDFDKSSFSKIDEETVEKVKEALKQGKKITFYPLTDNLGADNYNSNLSKARLQSALKLFADSTRIKTEIPKEPFFDNGHPFGRTLNRSIVVRIQE